MKEIPIHLKEKGFDQWFLDRAEEEKLNNFELARVIAVHKDSCEISGKTQTAFAEVSGKLMFNSDSPLDYPTVGDFVYAQFFDEDSFAVIHDIFPRKSILKRKTSGKKIDFQLVAANIDTAFIVQSFGPNYNIRRLERYLVMINESNITPVVLLSKSDLAEPEEIEDCINKIIELMPGIQIIEFSNIDNSGIDRITELLVPGKTFCLLGSSGVGKTTLLNNLMEQDAFATKEVRKKDGKGKHATTRRQMISLKNNAMIIDTPGMRELGNISTSAGIDDTFDEIAALAEQCFFNNCTHTNEKGCAVLLGIKEGRVSEERFNNYIKLQKESAFNEMSYLEKREKDKKFSKMVKSVMKQKIQKYK